MTLVDCLIVDVHLTRDSSKFTGWLLICLQFSLFCLSTTTVQKPHSRFEQKTEVLKLNFSNVKSNGFSHNTSALEYCIDQTQGHNSEMTSSISRAGTKFRSLFNFKMVLGTNKFSTFERDYANMQTERSSNSALMIFAYA